METNAFAALAHLKIIIIPIGTVQKSVFEKWSSVIRTFESIPLVDVPPARQEDKIRFMPTAAAMSGHLHLHYLSHPPPIWHHTLALFRPSSFPLGVIGITTCTTSTSLSAVHAEFNRKVKDLYPHNSPYPLARSCFAFEEGGDHTQLNTEDNGLEVIPSVLGPKISQHVGMLLAGLCSQILANFTPLVNAMDTPKGWEILHSGLFPPYPASLDDGPPPPLTIVVESPRSSMDTATRASTPPRVGSPPTVGASPPLRSNTAPLSRSSSSSGYNSTRNSILMSTAKKRQAAAGGNGPPSARLSKLLGDLFLLAGRLNDATIWYNDALAQFKSLPDPVWHASVLEGLCTISVLEAWAGSHGLQSSLSTTGLRDPWAEISDRMNIAVYMYYKTPLGETSNDYPSVVMLYSSCVLRYAHFLFSIWSSNGWGPMAFLTMLTPALPPTFTPEPPSAARRWRMTSVTTITRSSIANICAQAHGPWIMHLQPVDRIRLLAALAGFYSCLGFKRKEVYILRELVSVVVDLIVLAREERREMHAARFGVADGKLSDVAASAHVTIREHQLTDGNDSILRILTYICNIYGVNLHAIKPKSKSSDTSETTDDDDERLDFVREPSYGWPELQLGVVRESLAISEALPEYPSLAQFSFSTLRTLYFELTSQEQYSLYNAAKNAIQISQRRGDPFILEYWSKRPVISVEVLPLPFSRIPVEHLKTDLAPRDTLMSPIVAARDPFIYNPRLKSTITSQTVLIKHESVEVVITLQNPFLFDLEFLNVSLSTSGVPIESQGAAVVIPPNAYCPVTLTAVALESGQLTIRGCHVQLVGCDSQEFLLPLSTEEEEQKDEKRKSLRQAELDRFKFTGLDARPAQREKKRQSLLPVAPTTTGDSPNNSKITTTPRFVECKVIPEQPLLRIRRTSLTHGAVMLYDGESSVIRLTLENVSAFAVDFLKLTFEDSTITTVRQILADGDLSVSERYEIEYDLLRRPVFHWRSREEPSSVKPGQKVVLNVACLGKVGCVSGTMQIAYANARDDDSSNTFYTRQILYPVIVTVYHTLECHAMDILPFAPIITFPADQIEELNGEVETEEAKARRVLLEVDDQNDWCLFTVDVRNSYGLPFEVHFERSQQGTNTVTCSRLVPPGSTSRITLPLRRIFLSASQTGSPIPTLSERQFVVSKVGPGDPDQRLQRELFWYREELLNSVKAWWKEPGGTRNGELFLRKQRLTSTMLDNLKRDAVRVGLELASYGDEEDSDSHGSILRHVNGKTTAKPNQFYYLRCKAFNATVTSQILVLSISATPLEHFHVEGSLTEVPVGRVESNTSKEVEIPICFVAEGQFDFVCELRILGEQIRSGEGELKVIVKEED